METFFYSPEEYNPEAVARFAKVAEVRVVGCQLFERRLTRGYNVSMCPQQLHSFGTGPGSNPPSQLPVLVKWWLDFGYSVLLEDDTEGEIQAALDKIMAAPEDGGPF